MTAATMHERSTAPPSLRQLALGFLLTAVAFFSMILNPLTFDFFDAENDAALLAHIEEHHTALRLLFTGIGIAELALGVALWTWGRRVAAASSGRRRGVAQTMSVVALVAGVAALVARLGIWIRDDESLASDDITVFDVASLPAFVGFSLSFVIFGYCMFRGAMPRWLGVVWILCGVLFWLGILPLWFFVGALAFGIRGIIRFRADTPTSAISADSVGSAPTEVDDEHVTP